MMNLRKKSIKKIKITECVGLTCQTHDLGYENETT